MIYIFVYVYTQQKADNMQLVWLKVHSSEIKFTATENDRIGRIHCVAVVPLV
jgi:hypothetical protein